MLPLTELIQLTYEEDIPGGDITSELTVPVDTPADARIITKAEGVFFGTSVIRECIRHVDPTIHCSLDVADGDRITPNTRLMTLHGRMRSLLKFERVALNFLQRLCGVASSTRAYVDALGNANIQVLDTRKTTPLLRELEKQAIVAGGGANHRFGLSDMVLIKENHLLSMQTAGCLHELESRLIDFKSRHPNIPIEIEIETLSQIDQLPLHHADIVMFDNFPFELISVGAERLSRRAPTAKIEISGNITLDTISRYRHSPIHRISVGSLTHSVKALDLSMRLSSTGV